LKHTIITGDVLDGLKSIPDCSVQCVVTSPPYWGLRDYGVEGQLGLEKTPQEYVAKMVEVFREVKRVLRDDGVVWLNLGDCYSDKQMVGVPWLVAFALQEDGWYLRSDVIWHKPNPMPESISDRPTKSHEYIFLLTKSPKYYYDTDAIREPATCIERRQSGMERHGETYRAKVRKQDLTGNPTYTGFNQRYAEKMAREGTNIKGHSGMYNSKGDLIGDGKTRNKRTVWTITTQARPEAHFATFPDEIPTVCIKAGTSEFGCCSICGAPYKRDLDVTWGDKGKGWHDHVDDAKIGQRGVHQVPEDYKRETKGWIPTCECKGDIIPCVVLDPFGGSGTVAVVARELGRSSVMIELNQEYVKIMRKRLRIDEQLDTGYCEYEFNNL
jgi:DNA modification methylase